MQAVMCQWALVIQLLEFHNPKNIETRIDDGEIEYCCCDTSDTCKSKSDFFKENITCENKCDIFFVVSFYDGNSELYSISTIKTTIQDSPPNSTYGKNFSFALDDLPNVVSNYAEKSIICMHLKMYVQYYFSLLYSSILRYK